jgi:hypothetical protein
MYMQGIIKKEFIRRFYLHPLYMFAKHAQIINEVWDLDVHVCFEFSDGLVYQISGFWIRRHGKTGVSLKNSAPCSMHHALRKEVSYLK